MHSNGFTGPIVRGVLGDAEGVDPKVSHRKASRDRDGVSKGFGQAINGSAMAEIFEVGVEKLDGGTLSPPVAQC